MKTKTFAFQCVCNSIDRVKFKTHTGHKSSRVLVTMSGGGLGSALLSRASVKRLHARLGTFLRETARKGGR